MAGPISVTFTNADEIDVPSFITTSLTGAPSGVPEPATWAIMLGGLGLVAGWAMRRRKQAGASYA